MPVCAWVDGEYGISGVYLGVEAEIGRQGVRKVVEGDLTETELAGLNEAAEAVGPSRPTSRACSATSANVGGEILGCLVRTSGRPVRGPPRSRPDRGQARPR